jgi:hypothetical protein
MSLVGLEPTIPVFERAKTIHVLDRASTVIGPCNLYNDARNVKRRCFQNINITALKKETDKFVEIKCCVYYPLFDYDL